MTWRILYLTVVGLVLATIVHIAIILMIPSQGTRDAWTYLSGRTSMFQFSQLNSDESGFAIAEVDPFFKHGVCRFELDNFALKMSAPTTDLFWSASVFDEDGTVIYSLNNRTAIDGQLDLIILNAVQSLQLRDFPPEQIESSVIIEANIKFGFVVLRLFEPDGSWQEASSNFLSSVNCSQFNTVSNS